MSNLLNEGGMATSPGHVARGFGRPHISRNNLSKNITAMSVARNMFTQFVLTKTSFFDGWPTINERYQETKMLCNCRL